MTKSQSEIVAELEALLEKAKRGAAAPTEPKRRRRRKRREVLTDDQVKALPRRPKEYFYPDPELGKHGVRVRPTGAATYTVIIRDPYGKQRWVKVGSTDSMTIEEAREIARSVIKRVQQGLEPFEPPPPKPDSVAVVANNWLERVVAKSGFRTAPEIRRIIAKYVLPHWHERTFADIKRSDITALLDHVEDKHGPHQADAVLGVLRSVAKWVASRNDNYVPPFVGSMQRVPPKARARSRVLTDDEIARVWRAADDAGAFGSLIQLLLLTAQRREKLITMKWSDIAADGTWTIPSAEREKGTPAALLLPKLALNIIRKMPRMVGNPYVFAGMSRSHRGFNFARPKAAFDERCGVTNWRVHDCRRTARTVMAKIKVPSDHAELVLGHKLPGVKGIYDKHSYFPEMATALAALAAEIARIVDLPPPSRTVLKMPKAAASSRRRAAFSTPKV